MKVYSPCTKLMHAFLLVHRFTPHIDSHFSTYLHMHIHSLTSTHTHTTDSYAHFQVPGSRPSCMFWTLLRTRVPFFGGGAGFMHVCSHVQAYICVHTRMYHECAHACAARLAAQRPCPSSCVSCCGGHGMWEGRKLILLIVKPVVALHTALLLSS